MLQLLQERIRQAVDVTGKKRVMMPDLSSSTVNTVKKTRLIQSSEFSVHASSAGKMNAEVVDIWDTDTGTHSVLSGNVSVNLPKGEQVTTVLKTPLFNCNVLDEKYEPADDEVNDTSLLHEDHKYDSHVDIDPTSYLREIFEERGYDWKTWETINKLPNLGKVVVDESCIRDATSESSQGSQSPCMKGTVGRFDLKWKDILLSKDLAKMQKGLDESKFCNISNPHGDTILHKVCRYSSSEMLEELLSRGADVAICDESGRTPLHDGFWTAGSINSRVIELIMDRAPHLMLATDRFGAVPLKYVSPKLWSSACDWLDSVKDTHWPVKTCRDDDDDDDDNGDADEKLALYAQSTRNSNW